MISHQVWEGIDSLAFHENAILLDIRLRSQGIATKLPISDNDQFKSDDSLSYPLIRSFLDDFALVLSGPGGNDNVSAVCMENDEEHHMIILRVSRNDGVDEQKLSELERLVRLSVHGLGRGPLPSGWS